MGLEQGCAVCEVVGEAANGLDALEGILALKPDVAVLDVEMPGLTGLEVVRRLRDRGSRTPVILCSGGDTPPERLAEAACCILKKPVQFDELLRVVRSTMGGRGPYQVRGKVSGSPV